MAHAKPTYLGRVRMLVSMDRLLAIRTLANKYGWNQRETEANAKLLDMALESAHARIIETYDRDLEDCGAHSEERWEKFWNEKTEGDKVERLLTARKIFDGHKKKKRGR